MSLTKTPSLDLENKKSPTLKVCLQDESSATLKSLWEQQDYLVLYFYPRDNTPGCTTEAKDFQKNLSKFKKLNTRIIGCSPDSPSSHVKFMDKKNLKFDLISDPDKKLCEKFKVWQLKQFMGRKFMGVIRSTFIINQSGKIIKIYQPVKVKEHAQNVLEFIKNV